MTMDVKTQLHEGMKIAPLDDQEKEYTLIFSSVDNEMYMLFQKHIIKLSDMDKDELDTKWICTNLSSLKEEIKCVELENNKTISFDDFCIYSFEPEMINPYDDEDFISIDMRVKIMTREEYNTLKGFTYEIGLRDKIQEFYKKQQNGEVL